MITPLHERIRREMEARILSGALAPGDRLPTEHELIEDYRCARMTVNKALSALAATGLIERRKRAGSFVARPRLHAMVLDIPDLMQDVLRRGQSYGFDLLSREIRRAERNPHDDFDLGPGNILVLTGLHYADERQLAVEQRNISLDAVPDIALASFDSEPPGSWLLRHVPWTEAETRISAASADKRIAALLLLEVGAPLLQIERRTWRGEDRVTYVRQLFRAEAYDLFARFSARDIAKR